MKNLFLCLLTFLLSFSCEDSNSKENLVQKEHHYETNKISSNKGKKWKVDDNMIIYIRHIENLINNFEIKKDDDYVSLTQSLHENLMELVSSCTMMGKAHDELHNWLFPLIEHVEELEDATTNEHQEQVFEKIKSSIEIFNNHFE